MHITLYASIASRSFTAFWLLEELGVPYHFEEVDLRERQHKTADYLCVNPSGRVPAVEVDGQVAR